MVTTVDLARDTEFVATYDDEITVRIKDVRALVTAYGAFTEFAKAGEKDRARVWGCMLRRAQEDTGVEMIGADELRPYIEGETK